ncbi:MAG: Ig-like domain-containing protein [Bacteroidaceae bacterium]|nr:Ig-like domain-containing protein [Bacteroidaceae bacterium]
MRNKLLMTAVLATVLASCAKDSELVDNSINPAKTNTEAVVTKQPVQFGAYVNRAVTRAGDPGTLVTSDATEGQVSLQDKGFGVIAYYTDDDLYSPIYQPNFMYNTKVHGTNWEYKPVQYWPNETGDNAVSEGVDRLSFFAYAPYVNVTSATGIVEGDATSGIVGLSRNGAVGDPFVKYYVSLDPANQVDFSWGVSKSDGKPLLDMTKQPVNEKVEFAFNHALAALNVQVDAAVDDLTPGIKLGTYPDKSTLEPNAPQTHIYVRSITFEGFVTKGAFNLNTSKATWYDLAGANYIDGGSVTVYDGRTNGREGQSESVNEAPQGLNPVIVQDVPYNDAALQAGVTKTPVNLFNGSSDDPIYVIPSGQPLKVTIVYDVETATDELAGYLSDGVTHGTSVENKITKTISFADGNKLEAGKRYNLALHLGMTSVKFDATVSDWETGSTSETGLPYNSFDFSLSPSSTTVWIGDEIAEPTVTADLETTVAWSSLDEGIATVDASGNITAVSAGVARIQATATKGDASETAIYTVNVNEVTGVTVSPATDKVLINGQRVLTATLTHTNNGVISSWPTVSWESNNTAYVTVNSTSASSNSGGATSAVMYAKGVAVGDATVTATVNSPYATSAVSGTATLTVSGIGYYRGYDISKGILVRSDAGYTLVGEDDPFVLENYYRQASSLNKYYFQWSFLKGDSELGADGSNIKATSDKLPIYSSESDRWTMPTQKDWENIVKGKPKMPIQIENENGSVTTISVNQEDMAYAFVAVQKNDKTYYGTVLFKDGSTIRKEGGLMYWGNNSQLNNINETQLNNLLEDGCLFLSMTGYYSSTQREWRYLKNANNDEGHYWSATLYTGSRGYYLRLYETRINPKNQDSDDSRYYPVRLVKKMAD